MTEKLRLEAIKIEPNTKIENSISISDLYDKFLENFTDALSKAEKQLIQQVSDELGVDTKCAEKFLIDHFNIRIHTENPNSMIGTPKFSLVAEPKSVEEILNADDDTEFDWECEKQMLKGDK